MGEVNIINELEKITESFVECYKTDLEHDKKTLLEKRHEEKIYYFMARKCGTCLMPKNSLFVDTSYAYAEAKCYKDNDIKIYKITISKVGKKYVYGSIENINKKDFYQMIDKNKKSYDGIEYKVFLNGEKEPKKITIMKYDNPFIHVNIIMDNLKIKSENIDIIDRKYL